MDFDKLKDKYSIQVAEDEWWGQGNGNWVLIEEVPIGQPVWVGDDLFSVVEMKLDYNDQLYSNEVHIVINTGGEYFKLTGSKDSYGESSWNDSWKRVTPKTRTETYYS